jgi:hypothetical protein
MPVPKDSAFRRQATELADELFEHIDSGEYVAPLSREIETADVELTADRFGAMMKIARQWDDRIPCLDFGENGKAPIDFLPQDPHWRFINYPYPLMWESFERGFGQLSKLIIVKSEEARSFFRTGLISFLSSRFRFSSQSKATSPSKGLPFTVHTQQHGYRVHYTYAYLINTNPVFGAPTTPVSAYMKPGIWKFGVWQKGQVVLDPAEFDVPAVSAAHLVV